MATQREIKYVNREFGDFRNQLIEYAKSYFPDTYNDFSPTSPGMMFIEMAAYVGDVLSFYQDTQLQETYLNYAKDPKNLYSLAYMMGYRPKTVGVSEVDIQISQRIDATGVNYLPNWNQAAVIEPNLILQSTDQSQTSFLIDRKVDMTFSSSFDPTEVLIESLDGSNNPEEYLLRKTVKAFSSEIISTDFSIGEPEKFKTLTIQDSNIVGVLDITDSDGNVWYEVPFLGQDTIFEDIENTNSDSNQVPYTLNLRKVPNRFVTRHLSSGNLQIQFGAGINDTDDGEFLPNPENVGLGTNQGIDRLNTAYDPSNFIYSKAYGVAPANTILTVRYLKGGGITANVPTNTVTQATLSIGGNISSAGSDDSKLTSTFTTFNNPSPASGGRGADTVEQLRQNSLRAFNEQNRTVTLQDYTVRALSLPSKFGSVSKAFATQDQLTNTNIGQSVVENNPLSLSLYVLGVDNQGKLITASNTLKQNLRTYLSEYIPLTDAVNIKDAFIVNIGINYDIIVRPNYSSRDVLLQCNVRLQDMFRIDKWSINKPINLSDIYLELDKVKGVQTVQKVEIVNKNGGRYSQYGYDVKGATRNNIVYPSYDPCIFEVKFPESDIKGRTTTL